MNIIVNCPTTLSRGAETFGRVQPSTPSVWPPPVQAVVSSPVPVYCCSGNVTFPPCVGCAFTLPCRAFLLHCEDTWGVGGVWAGSPVYKVPAITAHWGKCDLEWFEIGFKGQHLYRVTAAEGGRNMGAEVCLCLGIPAPLTSAGREQGGGVCSSQGPWPVFC